MDTENDDMEKEKNEMPEDIEDVTPRHLPLFLDSIVEHESEVN